MRKIFAVFIILSCIVFYASFNRFSSMVTMEIESAIDLDGKGDMISVTFFGSRLISSQEVFEKFYSFIEEKDLNLYYSKYSYEDNTKNIYARSKDPNFLKFVNTRSGIPKELVNFKQYSTNAIDKDYKLFGSTKYPNVIISSFESFSTNVDTSDVSSFFVTVNNNENIEEMRTEMLTRFQKFHIVETEITVSSIGLINWPDMIVVIFISIILASYLLWDDTKSDGMIMSMKLEGYSSFQIYLKYIRRWLVGIIVIPVVLLLLFKIYLNLSVFNTPLFWEIVIQHLTILFLIILLVYSLLYFYIKERRVISSKSNIKLLSGFSLSIILIQVLITSTIMVNVFTIAKLTSENNYLKSTPEYVLKNYYYKTNKLTPSTNNVELSDEERTEYELVEKLVFSTLEQNNKGFIFEPSNTLLEFLQELSFIPSDAFVCYVDSNYIRNFIDEDYNGESSVFAYLPDEWKSLREDAITYEEFTDEIKYLSKRAPIFSYFSLSNFDVHPVLYVTLDFDEYRSMTNKPVYEHQINAGFYYEGTLEEANLMVEKMYNQQGKEFDGRIADYAEIVNLELEINNSRINYYLKRTILPVVSLVALGIVYLNNLKQRLIYRYGDHSINRKLATSICMTLAIVVILGYLFYSFTNIQY